MSKDITSTRSWRHLRERCAGDVDIRAYAATPTNVGRLLGTEREPVSSEFREAHSGGDALVRRRVVALKRRILLAARLSREREYLAGHGILERGGEVFRRHRQTLRRFLLAMASGGVANLCRCAGLRRRGCLGCGLQQRNHERDQHTERPLDGGIRFPSYAGFAGKFPRLRGVGCHANFAFILSSRVSGAVAQRTQLSPASISLMHAPLEAVVMVCVPMRVAARAMTVSCDTFPFAR